MGWVDTELVLVSLAAMLSPTTLTFSVLVLVVSDRPLRTGVWFYLGALTTTLAVGVLAAFFLGDLAAPSSTGGRKTCLVSSSWRWGSGARDIEEQRDACDDVEDRDPWSTR